MWCSARRWRGWAPDPPLHQVWVSFLSGNSMWLSLLPHHLDFVLARPAFPQGNHKIGDQGHLAELPTAVFPYILVIKTSGHQKTLAIEDRFGFQVTEASPAVSVYGDDMIVDKLLDERHEIGQRLAIERRDVRFALRLAQVGEVDFATFGKQIGNHFWFLLIDRDVIAEAKLLEFIAVT